MVMKNTRVEHDVKMSCGDQRFIPDLTLCSAGIVGQKNFISIELSKPYRMVLESRELVQAKQIVPLLHFIGA